MYILGYYTLIVQDVKDILRDSHMAMCMTMDGYTYARPKVTIHRSINSYAGENRPTRHE